MSSGNRLQIISKVISRCRLYQALPVAAAADHAIIRSDQLLRLQNIHED
jgi:hypothetical protein